MNTDNRFLVLFSVTVALLLLAACGAAQPTATTVSATEPPAPTKTPPPPTEAATGITITFEGDQCVYHGPERVPGGRIPLTLDVKNQVGHGSYAVGAVTLDEGKTLEDLRAWTSTTNWPLWGHDQGWVNASGGSVQERTIILFKGPLYLCCFLNPPNDASDVLGPIEIIPPASK